MVGKDSAIDNYAHLGNGTYLQVYDTYGVVKSKLNGMSVSVSSETIELLQACDGQHSIQEILDNLVDSNPEGDAGDFLEAIIVVNQLIRNKVVLLEKKQGKYKVPFISSQGRYYPEALHVELTTLCNLHCHFCYRQAGPHQSESRLPTSQLLNILGGLAEKGLRVVEITGGEPLLHPDLKSITDFCGNTFQLTSVLTNGTLINDAFVNSVLPIKNRIAFNVSLESNKAEEHDRRTGVTGSFARTINGIRQLSKHNFSLRVAMAVDANNWADVEPTLLLAKQLGATAFTYSAILPFGRAAERFGFWDVDAKLIAEKEKYLFNRHKDFFHILDDSQQQRMKQPGSCGAGHRTYAMDPAGNVRPCATFDSQLGVIGSLATQAPEVVFSHETARLFAEIETPTQEVCGLCKFTYFCRNCVLRSLTASRFMEPNECNWLQQPSVRKLADIIYAT
jgi:radical SAM protein with 4Fe4S-binding SPASM domain